MTNYIKRLIRSLIESRGKISFLLKTASSSSLLDVGCGNNSVRLIKSINSSIVYTGVDIADYNLSDDSKALIDRYILADVNSFSEQIRTAGNFDYILSSHNLEHCNNWEETLEAMCFSLKPGGRLFISTPTIKSAYFPSRRGTLNFHDDITHKSPIPCDAIIHKLESLGLAVEFSSSSYKPLIPRIIGWMQEQRSTRQSQVLKFTWAYWGFECVVWAKKPFTP